LGYLQWNRYLLFSVHHYGEGVAPWLYYLQILHVKNQLHGDRVSRNRRISFWFRLYLERRRERLAIAVKRVNLYGVSAATLKRGELKPDQQSKLRVLEGKLRAG